MPTLHHTAPTRLSSLDWMNEIGDLLPATYQDKAKELKAFVRIRNISTVEDLLRAVLCWAFAGLSLRQLGIWGTVQHVGALSDRAWSKRLTTTHAWILWLVGQLVVTPLPCLMSSQRRLRVVDASNLRSRHTTGSLLRLHTSYLLNEQRIDDIIVTTQASAESVAHLTWQVGDLAIADRGYCRRAQIAHIINARADILVRWHSTNVPLLTPQGGSFDAVAWVKELSASAPHAECDVSDGVHALRFIACRLSAPAAARARKQCRRKAQKKGGHLQETTVFLSAWLIVITTLTAQEASLSHLLDLYRARWQVELLFQRIKHVLNRHRLPSFHEHPNLSLVGILRCGWLLLEAYLGRLRAATPDVPRSLWQCQSLLVRTFQSQLFGLVTLSHLIAAWPLLQRYLRPSRPLAKRWSCERLLASLNSLLAPA